MRHLGLGLTTQGGDPAAAVAAVDKSLVKLIITTLTKSRLRVD